MAQGTFDLLTPGHLHYLTESAALGDELVVVLASDERVADREELFTTEESRRTVVGALAVVDEAIVGNEGDIYAILDEVEPDVVTIGFDQEYDLEELRADLAERGYGDVEVVRVSAYDAHSESVSASDLKQAHLESRGPEFSFVSVSDDADV